MRIRSFLLVAPVLALGLAACGTSEPAASAPAPAAKPAVKVAQTDLGPALADQSGRVLYAFAKDKDKNQSACDAGCITVWPALAAQNTTAGDGTKANLLGKTEPGGTAAQATYNGWPLYYYVGDATAGDINGEGVDDQWYLVSPDGKLLKGQA